MRPKSLNSLIKEPRLARVTERLKALKRNSIRIHAKMVEETTLPLGTSKFGGQPDLPPEIQWPIAKLSLPESLTASAATSLQGATLPPDQRIALPFIAQLRLTEPGQHDRKRLLPKTGILYFFYNAVYYPGTSYGTPEHWKVLYYAGDTPQLTRMRPPLPIPAEAHYPAHALTFEAEFTLPQVETCFIARNEGAFSPLTLTSEEWEAYADLRYELRANREIQQMLGYSDDLQPYAMEHTYAEVRDQFWPDLPPFKSLPPQERQRELEQGRLLLQVDGSDIRMSFGRGGRLYFFIREEDLRALNFNQVWVAEQ